MKSISIADYKANYLKSRRVKRRVSVKKVKAVSEGEAVLSQHLKAHKIEYVQEFQFNSERKWRADFHLVDTKILIEVEGGIWSNGRHHEVKGI